MSKKITFDDGKYEVGNWTGAWVISVESNEVPRGSVRVIGEILMSAHPGNPSGFLFWKKWEVWWSPVGRGQHTPEKFSRWVESL